MTASVNEEFFARCAAYREELSRARNFEEMSNLWRSTRIGYSMPDLDPGSPAYRQAVLAVYERLTQTGYEARNELTSNKQSPRDFEIGYPWVSRDLGVAASELGKTVQALMALQTHGAGAQSMIEFGCGWGNLAVPLAKLGRHVSVVDIDEAFLQRTKALAERDGFQIQTHHGDFVEVAGRLPSTHDAVIFQSSFHHCLDFETLMSLLADRVLSEHGRIYFFAEPIHRELGFPWGLRCDGESLWAIMCNGWLELGFDEDFFLRMALRHGFLVSRIPGVPGAVGEGWVAMRSRHGLAFADCALPPAADNSFWGRAADTRFGRFLRRASQLPPLGSASRYGLTLRNYCPRALRVRLSGDHGETLDCQLPPGAEQEVTAPPSRNGPLWMHGETVIPDRLIHNGDTREIGLALTRLATD